MLFNLVLIDIILKIIMEKISEFTMHQVDKLLSGFLKGDDKSKQQLLEECLSYDESICNYVRNKCLEYPDNKYASYCIANFMSNGFLDGDEKEVLKWYKKSAELGYGCAQAYVAYCYEHGFGIEANIDIAKEWYTKAAEQGDWWAQYNLILLYLRISKSNDKENYNTPEIKKSIEWLKKSAEQGETVCQYYLGEAYEFGIGCQKDIKKAFDWYLKSSENDLDGQDAVERLIKASEEIRQYFNSIKNQLYTGI